VADKRRGRGRNLRPAHRGWGPCRLVFELERRGHPGVYTGAAGDAAGAREQFAALLPVRERVSGPEHPDTLTARHNLASWTGQARDAG